MNVKSKLSAILSLAVGLAVPAMAASGSAPSAAVQDSSATPAQDALNTLIASPSSPLPTGTRLRSLSIKDGLATADFSREIKDNFQGGDTAEANAVNAILRTLGRFPTVDRVQILVEEQPVESLGGLLVISQPLAAIRPVEYMPGGHLYLHRRIHQEMKK